METTSDFYYGEPKKMFFRLHKEAQACRRWRDVKKNVNASLSAQGFKDEKAASGKGSFELVNQECEELFLKFGSASSFTLTSIFVGRRPAFDEPSSVRYGAVGKDVVYGIVLMGGVFQ